MSWVCSEISYPHWTPQVWPNATGWGRWEWTRTACQRRLSPRFSLSRSQKSVENPPLGAVRAVAIVSDHVRRESIPGEGLPGAARLQPVRAALHGHQETTLLMHQGPRKLTNRNIPFTCSSLTAYQYNILTPDRLASCLHISNISLFPFGMYSSHHHQYVPTAF
jgi:hypothetical protein